MAVTLTTQRMRVVGSTTGGPPYVQTFGAGEAMKTGQVVFFDDTDGLIYIADGTALVTAGSVDDIDLTDMTHAGTEGALVGMVMGDATAAQVTAGRDLPVAMFCPTNIFEGNVTNDDDGSNVGTEVWALTDRGDEVAINRFDAALPEDAFFRFNIGTATERAGWILRGGYGFAGEPAESGHGVIGDTNVRVQVIITQSGLEAGETYLMA